MEYDLIVIGAGPGGYVSAIRGGQLGLKVAVIDKRKTMGGTCLNVGCIPSKALLQSSYKFYDAQNHFAEHGITATVKADIKKMQARKNNVVADLTKGIDFLLKKNNVDKITGSAEIIDSNTVSVGSKKIKTKKIIIATGSEVASLPNIKTDEKNIVSSTGALEFNTVPKHLVVIGGGVIGVELGSVWARLGSKVTIVEYADNIIANMDTDIVKEFSKSIQNQGIELITGTKVLEVKNPKSPTVVIENNKDKKQSELKCDKVLVAVGRKPCTDGLGLDKVAIEMDEHGFISVDENYQTSLENVFAIGDVIGGAMLAHKAEEEGVATVEKIAGLTAHINYNTIPSIIYTHPEVASVGFSEDELKDTGISYNVGKFPFMANSRGRAVGETDGFVKVIAEAETDILLGVHIIGADAGTVIHEAIVVMEYTGTAEDLYRTCHGHPTLNEAVKEACLDVHKRAIHS